MDDNKKWTFPKYIAFEDVSDFMQKFDSQKHIKNIIFDLKNTTRVHSSFIGFLIYAKSTVEKEGGSLKMNVSQPVKKLFEMLQLLNHFSPTFLRAATKKSA